MTCATCGVLVGDPDQHRDWHDGYDELVTRVVEELDGPQ